MDYRILIFGLALLLAMPTTQAAVTVEIAAETGPQATAQQKWLQLFADAGATGVRIRQAQSGDKPRIDELGTEERPRPKLIAVLGRNGVLRVPGSRFTLRDRAKLTEYLERLEGDGTEGVTAARGSFGLTEKQFTEVFEVLKAPIGPLPLGATLSEVVSKKEKRLPLPIDIDPAASVAMQAKGEQLEKIAYLSTGTALALLLKQEGLSLVPHKPIGKPPRLRIAPTNRQEATWPLGYKPEASPRETAPVLFEWLTVEIDGYSLSQAIDAIEPRLSKPGRPLPILWDHFALRSNGIDPSTVSVTLAPKKTFYKRILDRLAIQARLKAELRIDEAGAPFVWMTR